MTEFPNTLIIVGAPRSGTNILRDTLTKLNGVCSWPCDELPFVWKAGRVNFPYDDLAPDDLSDTVKKYIRNCFIKFSRSSKAELVIEKTCANSLRVNYVDAAVPTAKYVFLVRDGFDSVPSAVREWKTPKPGFKYYIKKVRFVRMIDFPAVVKNVLAKRFFSKKSSQDAHSWSFWGPRFRELDDLLLENKSLEEVCTLQWSTCVEKSIDQLSIIENNRILVVRYEQFVQAPAVEISRILQFAGLDVSDSEIEKAAGNVHSKSVSSKQRTALDESLQRKISSTNHRVDKYCHG